MKLDDALKWAELREKNRYGRHWRDEESLQVLAAEVHRLQAELTALHEIIAVARNDAGGNVAILIANGRRKIPVVLPLPEGPG